MTGSRKLANDCFLHDKDRLKHHEAIGILRDKMVPIIATETVSINAAARRILAENVIAPRNIPAFDNAAVDGYGFRHEEFEQTGGYFPVVSRVTAGDGKDKTVPAFSAVRIFTGALMPDGLDTVAMQEDCALEVGDGIEYISIPTGLKLGANRRRAGEDVSEGESVARAGSRLRPQDIAAIASTGTATIPVYRSIRIGLLSSGNEILRPGQPHKKSKVYDANQPMLSSMLQALGCDVTDLGILPDNRLAAESLLQIASKEFDVIITTGGASKGEEDHLVNALEHLGKQHMWQLAIKPGRPMSFGQIDDTVCFTLPGNPVAAFVCFLLYVRPSLIALSGGSWPTPAKYPLPAAFSLRSKPDRREFLRGFVEERAGKFISAKV